MAFWRDGITWQHRRMEDGSVNYLGKLWKWYWKYYCHLIETRQGLASQAADKFLFLIIYLFVIGVIWVFIKFIL
jgi:hypothetical protein